MPYKNGNKVWNEIVWTDAMISFVRENFHEMTNSALADHLQLGLTSVRTKCYQLGLKRMDLEYWNDEQINYLKENYREIGDTEIAELFASKWPKKKGWSKKHIEKKRRQLGLKRTKKQISAIIKNNCKVGGPSHTIDKNSSSKNLHPKWVVQQIAWRNKDLQQEILSNHPNLIQQKKLIIQVNRRLKEIAHNKIKNKNAKQNQK